MMSWFKPNFFNLLSQTPQPQMQKKLAVLIDAENISPDDIKLILDEIAKYGVASIKRIYGDWTTPQMNTWKSLLPKFALQPIHQFTYVAGKNSSDFALVVDVMDILYNTPVDGFCIVSSDSDYTKLAVRVRESGKIVYGFGEEKTPEAFRQACDVFVLIENLKEIQKNVEELKEQMKKEVEKRELVDFLKKAVTDVAGEDGWANLPDVGNVIRNRRPDFDYRAYSSKRLSDLLEAMGSFEFGEPPDHVNQVRVTTRRRK